MAMESDVKIQLFPSASLVKRKSVEGEEEEEVDVRPSMDVINNLWVF